MNRISHIPFCNTNTCKGASTPPSSLIRRLLIRKRKLREKREEGGDNGFHQIPPLSQIKMPAWRALAIFLFICLLIFFFLCHWISGPIYCPRPASHTRRSQPQSDRPLSYSSHRWFLLVVLIAKLSPSHLITSLRLREFARLGGSDGRRGQCPGGPARITALLTPHRTRPCGPPNNLVTAAIRRSQKVKKTKRLRICLAGERLLPVPPPPCPTGPSVTPL